MLVFVKNIGQKYYLGGVVSSLVFSQNCQKITWGHHRGHQMCPGIGASWGVSDAPMLFFDNLVKELDKMLL